MEPARMNYPGLPEYTEALRDTGCGRCHKWKNMKKWERAFILLSPFSILVLVGLNIREAASAKGEELVFAVALVFTTGMCCIYVIKGVLNQLRYEILVFIASIVIVCIYVVVHYAQSSRKKEPFMVGRLAATLSRAVANILMAGYAIEKYPSCATMLTSRLVGTDASLQKACIWRFIFIALLTVDFHLVVNAMILDMHGRSINTIEFGFAVGGGLFTLITSILGYLSMRFESRCGTITFVVCCWALPGYEIHNIVKTCVTLRNPSLTEVKKFVFGLNVSFSLIFLGVRAFLIVMALIVRAEYGRGLSKAMYPKDSECCPCFNREDNSEESAALIPGRRANYAATTGHDFQHDISEV